MLTSFDIYLAISSIHGKFSFQFRFWAHFFALRNPDTRLKIFPTALKKFALRAEYGQGGALGLATYLRVGSNLEIWQVRKIGGRPQYFRMTHYTEILNLFWQHLDYQWCTMLFSNRMVLYIIWNLAGWYSKLVKTITDAIQSMIFQNDLKYVEIRKKSLLPLIM